MKPILLVLAAGLGSRYGGIKQLESVGQNSECLLDFAVYDAMKSGFSRVVFIIRSDIEHDFRERLFDRIERNFDASYVFQTKESLLNADEVRRSASRAKPWGTLHAVLCAESALDAPYAVINSDDYYGRDAFAAIESHLSSIDNTSTDYAMVGYVLKNTMSENGSVSRGICDVKAGYLSSIVENTKISYREGGIVSDIDGREVMLTGDECVSMNLFGFSPKAYVAFHKFWDAFKTRSIESAKDEALLPSAVGDIIERGEGRVRVLTSDEKWFGMTYTADRDIVRREIAQKIASGYYPAVLWDK